MRKRLQAWEAILQLKGRATMAVETGLYAAILQYLLEYLLWVDGNVLRPALEPASQFDDLREQVCGAKEHIDLAIAQYLPQEHGKQAKSYML